ncbi:MAG: NAD-dependent epimerase/dehydratase family protein [Candidatus Odinarchaeota archaeon]
MMEVLLLGATGFLGSQVGKKLAKNGIDYIPVPGTSAIDLRDRQQFNSLFDENGSISAVINCAAYTGGIRFGLEYPADIFINNMLININLFETARVNKVARVINPISNCTYPRNASLLKEEEWWDGNLDESALAFGTVRKANWVQSWAYNRQYKLDTVNLIFPNMYGPEDHFDPVKSHALGSFIHKFIHAKLNGDDSVTIWGTGKPVREWIYVEDSAEIIIKSLNVEPFTEPVNVGIGEGITVLELANLVKEVIGYKGTVILDKTKPDGAPYKVMDNSRMLTKFNGWKPSVSLRAGIEKTVDWYYENILDRNE